MALPAARLMEQAPPADFAAEQCVIGGLVHGEVIEEVLNRLRPKDFYSEQHSRIYKAALELIEEGVTPGLISMVDILRRHKVITDDPNSLAPKYLYTCMDMYLASSQALDAAKIVQKCAFRRNVIHTGFDLARTAQEGGDWEEMVRQVQDLSFTLPTEAGAVVRTTHDDLDDIINELLTRYEPVGCRGIRTGFPTLDYMTDGLLPELMWLIAARPSIGKTAYALSLLRHVVRQHPVKFFSLEQSRTQILWRLLSMETDIPSWVLKHSVPDQEQIGAICRAHERVKAWPLDVDDTPGLTVGEIRRRARLAKANGGLDLIVIDHAGKVRVPGNASLYERQTTVARGLKDMAKELEVPVILLVQLSRASEKREDKRPLLSDIRDSGAYEEEADVIGGLHREGYYSREKSDPNTAQPAELNILKCRDGATGEVPLEFTPAKTFFNERAEEGYGNSYGG